MDPYVHHVAGLNSTFTEDWTRIGSHGLEYKCHSFDHYYVVVDFRYTSVFGSRNIGQLWSNHKALNRHLFRKVYQWERDFEDTRRVHMP